MAEIVFAAGVPHAPALIGLFDQAPDEVRTVVTDSFRSVMFGLEQTRPDVMLVFANDHLTNSRITAYPDFLIGAAPTHSGPHEWFKPWIGCRDYEVTGAPETAKTLFAGMGRRGVRMNIEAGPLKFDDNISVPVVLTSFDDSGIPLVPILQNCTVPPFPDQYRCYDVGKSVAEVIREDFPDNMRVALLGSGGLSHEPGGARYYQIDEGFDQRFLEMCCAADHDALLREITVDDMESAGVGGTSEILAWHIVMGAIGEVPGRSFGYTGWTKFRCGVGAVIWDVAGTG